MTESGPGGLWTVLRYIIHIYMPQWALFDPKYPEAKKGPLFFFWCFLVQLSARVILIHAESFWAILIDFVPFKDIYVLFWIPWGGPIWHIIMYYVPENCFRATRTILGLVGPFSPLLLIFDHFRPFWAISGPLWVPKWPHGWANITYDHVLCPWELFQGHQDHFVPCRTIFATSDDFGPF